MEAHKKTEFPFSFVSFAAGLKARKALVERRQNRQIQEAPLVAQYFAPGVSINAEIKKKYVVIINNTQVFMLRSEPFLHGFMEKLLYSVMKIQVLSAQKMPCGKKKIQFLLHLLEVLFLYQIYKFSR